MESSRIDYIIVGLGLAGASLALRMLKYKKRIMVVDNFNENSATRVAAGIFNPITGKRMNKTWMADTLFPALQEFYRNAEAQTGQSFFHSLPVYRPFISIEEQNEWMGKSEERAFKEFIDKVYLDAVYPEHVKNPFGGLLIRHAGYLDTSSFCNAVADILKKENALIEGDFDETRLRLTSAGIYYHEIAADKVIYCNGVAALESKYWNWVPIRPLKGEILKLRSEEKLSALFNRGVYVVPETLKVGATYNKLDTDAGATASARAELTEKLDALVNFSYEIEDQQWAFRPTTPDRRPILGEHPEFRQLLIFNGLGTKGVSLAPYFSGVFFDWIENGLTMNEAVDLNRYKSLYWKSA